MSTWSFTILSGACSGPSEPPRSWVSTLTCVLSPSPLWWWLSWGSVLCCLQIRGQPGHTHCEPTSGYKPWWPRWGYWSGTALLSGCIPFSFLGWFFNSLLWLVFSASQHSALAGEAIQVCRCCWSHWDPAQQLANPFKLLGCSIRVHLPFCLLQPPVFYF